MNSYNQPIIFSSEEETRAFAKAIAAKAQANDIITFSGDLGSGKTFMCREIIKQLCHAPKEVISPTFNLLQLYKASEFIIYHFDLYRLKHIEEIYELGIEEAFQGNLCLIEWPQIIEKILPLPITKIHLQIVKNNHRHCRIDYLE
ncbi:tRNA (adenosine(37)-N6)-threonylcarbamoyltransferase complex ATPase subunit type 1 TsaE [Candidatus Tisiphia endosymbiont of Beris chalybata]|uniref:tRNA (adenosine(37)-N6)-threonylcarbamoyltransferase complex ATPase subunit type 1 TsaE n=1 Tax=Candidatus Tisiphia endosymbiont of Beris chalybata TaxID=3066262 RepID=UPI00312CA949